MLNRGFVIMALGDVYEKCAQTLVASIKKTMPNESVTVITNDMVTPQQNDNPMAYDWQIYDLSPYEYTIKLEADMIIPKSISHWWEILKTRDLVVCNTIRNFKQDIVVDTSYRRFIHNNNLPNVYNGLTYFKKSEQAKTFFDTVNTIFMEWETIIKIMNCDPAEPVSTDWVYSIACHVLGQENTLLPTFTDFSFVHMKQHVNGLPTEKWTNTLVYEILPHVFRVNTVPQLYPFHYYLKDFSDDYSNL